MNNNTKRLIEEALRLPPDQRAAVAGSLLASLDETVDEDAEAAWAAGIQTRIHEIDSANVKTVPWAQARQMILAEPDAQT
jgi:putative addiction module component (TIGR02574 family)